MARLLHNTITLLAGTTMLVIGACGGATDTDSAPTDAASDAATESIPDLPPADEQATSQGAYKKAETEAGTGKVSGEVRWNSAGVPNLDVMLCSDLSTILGLDCNGEEFNTKTAEDGTFSFENVPVEGYSLAVRVFDTDSWIFQTKQFGLEATELEVQDQKELIVPATNIYKPMAVSSPADEGTVDSTTPTLTWPALPEADYYELYLSARDLEPPYEDSIVGLKITDTEYTVETALTKCSYTWRIEAFNKSKDKLADTDLISFNIAGCQAPSSNDE